MRIFRLNSMVLLIARVKYPDDTSLNPERNTRRVASRNCALDGVCPLDSYFVSFLEIVSLFLSLSLERLDANSTRIQRYDLHK